MTIRGGTAAAVLRPALLVATLFVVAPGLAATAAQAGEASDVADRGAFLLGHAYRCGVQAEKLQAAAQLIHDLAGALAGDDDDKTKADKVFAERFVVSAVSDSLGQPLPSCAAIKRELTQLDHHNPEAGISGTSSAPEQAKLSDGGAEPGPAKHAKAAPPAKSAAPKLAARQKGRHAPAI